MNLIIMPQMGAGCKEEARVGWSQPACQEVSNLHPQCYVIDLIEDNVAGASQTHRDSQQAFVLGLAS